MLISILSIPVESLDMSCAETSDALAPQDWDLKSMIFEALASDVWLQEVKFILNLPLYHIFWRLSSLGLSEFAIVSPLEFEPSLIYFDRQLAAVGEPLPKTLFHGLVLDLFIGLVVQLLMLLDKVHYSILI